MDLIIGLGVAAFAGAGTYAIVRYGPPIWRDEFPYARMHPVPTSWLWGPMLWRAWVRSWFVGMLGTLTIWLAVPFAFVDDGPAWYGLLFLAAFFGWFATAIAVVLVNRPKALVPPHLRSAPGIVHELLRREGDEGT